MRLRTATTLFAVVALLSVTAGGAPALAQGIERLGDFDDWSAFRFTENGNKACYMASQPVKAEGNYTKRGDIYALVTHRPAENRRDEVSFIAGYSFKENSTVQVTVGKQSFQLFTSEDGAWTANKDEDQKLVQAMIKGNNMVVKGNSSRGTTTKDSYSLKGFTSAYQSITETCGLK